MSLSLGKIPNTVRTVDVADFSQSAFNPNVPLLVRGAAARARRKWTESWTIERFGDSPCQVSMDSRPAMPSFEEHMPVVAYLDAVDQNRGDRTDVDRGALPYLVHSERDRLGAEDVLRDLDVPAAITSLGRPSLYRFFVGAADTGTLPHYHTFAINALARGHKRWAIYVGVNRGHTDRILASSYRRFGRGTQAKEWFDEAFPDLRSRRVRLWEFIQGPGDLVYIPAFAIHAVINMEPVTGFTVEFQPPTVRRRPGARLRPVGLT